MIHFLKEKECKVYAPVEGRSIPLETVPDPVFAQKMMGEGIGFEVSGDTVCAPCDGELIVLMPTKHAFGIKAKNGAEILVHIGLDTVNLNGEGFTVLAAEGEKVKAHQPIIRINRGLMQDRQINLTTPMVVSNMDQFEVAVNANPAVSLHDVVMTVKKK